MSDAWITSGYEYASGLSFHCLGEKGFHGSYRLDILEKEMPARFHARAHALPVFGVPAKPDRKRDVFLVRCGDEFLKPDALQDAAGEPPAQKAALAGDDRQAAFHGPHRGVESRESDRVQKNIGAFQESMERRKILPGDENCKIVQRKLASGEYVLQPLPQPVRQVAGLVREEYELAAAQSSGDLSEKPIVPGRILERYARTEKNRSGRIDAQVPQIGIDGRQRGGPVVAAQIRQGHELL